MVPFIRVTALLLFFICLPAMAWSQDKPSRSPKSTEVMPPSTGGAVEDDPLGRGTPRGTVAGFMRAANRQDYLRAGEYLETRKTGEKREEIARQLEAVLEHSRSTNIESLSRNSEGNLSDGLPINQEKVGLAKTKTDSLEIILKRVQQGNNPPIWLFSAETLKLVPQTHEEIDIPWLEQKLPPVLTETRAAGLPIYRWFIAILVLPSAFLVGWLLTALLMAVAREPLRRRADEQLLLKLRQIKRPLRLIV
ncbi:MAG: hypothetical protein L7F78_23670, partial [Syntrophales bacterium LBB04]|nr:hypothetical protein [Syntrophales bacterium LBB04]